MKRAGLMWSIVLAAFAFAGVSVTPGCEYDADDVEYREDEDFDDFDDDASEEYREDLEEAEEEYHEEIHEDH